MNKDNQSASIKTRLMLKDCSRKSNQYNCTKYNRIYKAVINFNETNLIKKVDIVGFNPYLVLERY